MLERRRAGVLLHPTSLPGEGPVGRIGAEAHRFLRFLEAGGFSVWQTLPLGPVDQHGSPYLSQSTHAGDTRLIDEHALAEDPELPAAMDFACVRDAPTDAYRSFRAAATSEQARDLARFMHASRRWLLPYVLFVLCRDRYGGEPWWRWPDDARHRDRAWLRSETAREKGKFRGIAFQQYLFERQWSKLKHAANERGILLFGDLPFYVDLNSVEVWWDRDQFRVDGDGRVEAVAGVPPDYFNADGQLWGNPLYDWDVMQRRGYDWWLERLEVQLERFDVTRIDHFRALESYWEVPASSKTAREGRWREGHGEGLLSALERRLGTVPLVAEDLGMITREVRALRDRFGLPGMLVLEFGFDGSPEENPHYPPNHVANAVVYTGTHDNDTLLGWCRSVDGETRRRALETLAVAEEDLPEAMMEATYASPARLAVVPMQDLLELGSEARMNRPGTRDGNWRWRFRWEDVGADVAARAHARAERHGRAVQREDRG